MAEKHIQRKVVEYAEQHKILALKVNVGSQRGWPDYLFIDSQGYHFWIEFKDRGKTQAPIQQYRAQQLLSRGCAVFLCDNIEYGKEIIDAVVAARIPERSDKDAGESGERRIITGPGIRKD